MYSIYIGNANGVCRYCMWVMTINNTIFCNSTFKKDSTGNNNELKLSIFSQDEAEDKD